VEAVPLEDLLDGVSAAVVVRIKGKREDDVGPAAAVAARVRGILAARGFKVLDEEYLKGSALGENEPAALAPGDLKAQGRRYLARVLVYGDVSVADAGELSGDIPYGDVSFEGVHTARATGVVRAVATSDGRVLAERASGPREFTGFGLSYGDAAADALARMAEACAESVAAALTPKEE
jgi:hypothetical protein